MSVPFERNGVRFLAPDDWESEIEEDGESWTASLQGPGTAFLVISFVPDIDDPTTLVDAAVEGLRGDYPQLEAENAVETLAGQPAIGVDVSFVHFDLINTCWIRALPAGAGALLLMAQCTDEELPDQGEVLRHILASVTTEE